MYLIKNALRNVTRNKGRNILIGVIITVITICTCTALAIHKAGTNLVNNYIKSNPLEVSFNIDMFSLRQASDDDKTNFTSLTVDDIKKYADSNLVKDYYYTLETSINGNNIEAVSDNIESNNNENNDKNKNQKDEMKGNFGDFRITAYSNFAYLSDFTNGSKKITSGNMVSGSSNDNEIVISEDLAEKNSLKVGDEIILSSPSNEELVYTFKIVGIYKNVTSDQENNFLGMDALNSSNQIYTNLNTVQTILDDTSNDDNTKLIPNNGLTAKFYLKDNNKVKAFTKEVRKKGLSDYYNVRTNEDEVLQEVKPIKNITTFSINFLIVILVIGIVVLSVINFLNIRDRKYEIGVLRAIGMNKFKVTSQLVLEVFIVSLASLVIGTTIGTIISQPVTNKMLSSEINSYKEEQQNTKENFGGAGFEKPSHEINNNDKNKSKNNSTKSSHNNSNYVDSLKVKIDITTILELFGISILLTATSALVASAVINKYSPNKILQNRT